MTNKTDKQREIDNMRLEAVRQAELQRKDLDLSNEYDAAIYSIWYLLNPMGIRNRDSVGTADICENVLPAEKTKSLKFTAHAHHNEPLEESPDDILVYSRFHRFSRAFIHFVTDRFNIRRLR